jgi:large subunit ribosomal protein L4
MATVDVVTIENEKSGSLDLDPGVFQAEIKPHLFHAEVRRQLSLRRAGTHSSKNRSAVSGGGSKPWRQKGTGRARQGTIRAPQWAGGGATFGPVPRDHGHKLPKKVRRAALRCALSQHVGAESLTVLEGMELDAPKTRRMLEVLKRLGIEGESVLIVLGEANENVELAARNLAGVDVIRCEGINVYDVLWHSKLILTRDAVAKIEARLAEAGRGATA